METKAQRDLSIDLIKILAMIDVLILHCINRLSSVVSFILAGTAGIAIPLFFMVSGYLTLDKSGGYRYSLKKIYGIVKYVTIFTLIKCLISFFVTDFTIHDLGRALIDPYIQRGILYPFWFFGAMIIVYLFRPILFDLNSRNDSFLKWFLIAMFLIETVVFALNATLGFEPEIIQTFRVWNWLFYYCLGAYIKKADIYVKPILIPLAVILYLSTQLLFKESIPGIEYFFPAITCILAATTIFISLKQMRITKGEKLIRELSKLFVPVFSFHILVLFAWKKFCGMCGINVGSDYINLFVVIIVTLSLSWAIMKTKYLSKIFKI